MTITTSREDNSKVTYPLILQSSVDTALHRSSSIKELSVGDADESRSEETECDKLVHDE